LRAIDSRFYTLGLAFCTAHIATGGYESVDCPFAQTHALYDFLCRRTDAMADQDLLVGGHVTQPSGLVRNRPD
jgi:hypothetical protein